MKKLKTSQYNTYIVLNDDTSNNINTVNDINAIIELSGNKNSRQSIKFRFN